MIMFPFLFSEFYLQVLENLWYVTAPSMIKFINNLFFRIFRKYFWAIEIICRKKIVNTTLNVKDLLINI